MPVKVNIPETDRERIVILGAGFAGMNVARGIQHLPIQIVLVDRFNFHQFQPLYYQVAMAGLEPSSISFPLRQAFRAGDNVHVRVLNVDRVEPENKRICTEVGILNYDKLIIATGGTTNFLNNDKIREHTYSLKSVSEAILLRNAILTDLEKAITTTDFDERQGLVDVVVVGGGPTGVEVAGALAEMKKFVLPKEYPEFNSEEMDIYLIQATDQLLMGMSEEASEAAKNFLEEMGVKVIISCPVEDVDGEFVYMAEGNRIRSNKVIWAAGIIGNVPNGIPDEIIGRGNRIKVDRYSQVKDMNDVFAIGDVALMTEPDYPEGHPQLAPVAIQQAKHLAKNIKRYLDGKEMEKFTYKNKGALATIGRNKAVADLPNMKLQGYFAWLIWGVVHLFSLIGTKNKIFVFLNWIWNYFTYDRSLRLIIRPAKPPKGGSK